MKFVERINQYHDEAVALTGLDDFGGGDYLEPMKLVLSDYDRYNRFTDSGRQQVGGEVVRRLSGRLMACRGFSAMDRVANPAVDRPLFVIGAARSGTTATLRLLSRDPEAQCLQYWLAVYPQPRPPKASWIDNPHYRRTVTGLGQTDESAPGFHRIHPEAAEEPDEDRLVLEQTFWACSMASMATAPNYSAWCADVDASPAYRYFRRVLELIAAGDTRRWVLKCPLHIWGLDGLLEVFPRANIVFTHRDPLTSIASTASMVYALRTLREEGVTPEQVGREMLVNWGRALDKSEQVRQRYPDAQFLDLHVAEIRQRPAETIEKIHARFGLPLAEASRRAMARFAEVDPSAGHGTHDYSPSDFGLTERAVIEAVGDYWERNQKVYASSLDRR